MFHANAATVIPLQVAADIHALMQHANDNKLPLVETIEYKMGADRVLEVAVPNIDNPSGFAACRQTIESIDDGGVVAVRLLNRPVFVCVEPDFFEVRFGPG
jgi:hypothetical protein